jgi:hypothetical protein
VKLRDRIRLYRHAHELADRIELSESITPNDLFVIKRALEDRARLFAGEPAGIAAEKVRAKIGAIK